MTQETEQKLAEVKSGALHTLIMNLIREDIQRQRPDAFTEDADFDLVITAIGPKIRVKPSEGAAYVKIDVSDLAEAVLPHVQSRAAPSPDTGKMGGEGVELSDRNELRVLVSSLADQADTYRINVDDDLNLGVLRRVCAALSSPVSVGGEDEAAWLEAEAQLSEISAAIGSPRFMDPPDGGSVTLAEQVRRMRVALEEAEARAPVSVGDGEAVAWLDGLEKLADAATPGPWSAHDHTTYPFDQPETWVGYARVGFGGEPDGRFAGTLADLDRRKDGSASFKERASKDAAFIAAVNPEAIKRLIAMARAHPSDPDATERMRAALSEIVALGSDGEHSGDRHARCRDIARQALADQGGQI